MFTNMKSILSLSPSPFQFISGSIHDQPQRLVEHDNECKIDSYHEPISVANIVTLNFSICLDYILNELVWWITQQPSINHKGGINCIVRFWRHATPIIHSVTKKVITYEHL